MALTVTFKANRLQSADRVVPIQAHQSLLEVAQDAGVPMGFACGGVCACSTCHCRVLAGAQSLTDMEDDESDRLDQAFDVRQESRLGCQSMLLPTAQQSLVIEISEESLEAYVNEHPELKIKTAPP